MQNHQFITLGRMGRLMLRIMMREYTPKFMIQHIQQRNRVAWKKPISMLQMQGHHQHQLILMRRVVITAEKLSAIIKQEELMNFGQHILMQLTEKAVYSKSIP